MATNVEQLRQSWTGYSVKGVGYGGACFSPGMGFVEAVRLARRLERRTCRYANVYRPGGALAYHVGK